MFASSKPKKLFLLSMSVVTAVLLTTASGFAAGGGAAGQFADDMTKVSLLNRIWLIAPVGAVLALIFAFFFYKSVIKASEGSSDMVHIADSVRRGAMAYLRQQYKVVGIVFVIITVLFGIMAAAGLQSWFVIPAFLTGGFFSALSGYYGMKTATDASGRTANGCKSSLNEGLKIAFRSGSVMGLTVVGLGLLNVALWYLLLQWLYNNGHVTVTGFSADNFKGMMAAIKGGNPSPDALAQYREWYHAKMVDITATMLTFAIGASTQALFARVGGGIYTKAADVGADLVGKVEAGIPEDDPRNPATIADNVGDNVGDVAGMGADLFESYLGSILATAALGAAAWSIISRQQGGDLNGALALVMAPMIVAGIGIVLSIISIFFVRVGDDKASQKTLLKALGRGTNTATVLVLVAVALLTKFMFPEVKLGTGVKSGLGIQWGTFMSVILGLLAGWVIGKASEYYTSAEFKPVQGISQQTRMGHATAILDGISVGMLSTWVPVIAIGIAIIGAFWLPGGLVEPSVGLYGVGIAAVGMLSTLGITLATDAYGPIADNAGGNAEMTSQEPYVRERTDALDSLGNTTAATGKGFAIGSAALTALALLAAYIEAVKIHIKTNLNEKGRGYFAVGADREEPYIFVIGDKKAGITAASSSSTKANSKQEKKKVLQTEVLNIQAEGSVLRETSKSLKKALTAENADRTLVAFNAIVGKELAVSLVGGKDLLAVDKRATLLAEVKKSFFAYLKNKYPVKNADKPWTDNDYRIVATARGATAIGAATLGTFVTAYRLHILNPLLLVGLFIGSMMAFVFCAMTLKAVGRAASKMVEEVRRQFRSKPRIMEYKFGDKDFPESDKPEYEKCVAIATAGAQREMLLPSLLAIIIPILTGVILGIPGVMGLLAGGLATGFCLAIYMANAGAAWDNAKKSIEQGQASCKAWLDEDNLNKAKELGITEEKDSTIVLKDSGQLIKFQDISHENEKAKFEPAARVINSIVFTPSENLKEITYQFIKGSGPHMAGVTGDTVGDPFKDTSGPSLNILIKLMSMVSVVAAGLVVAFSLLG